MDNSPESIPPPTVGALTRMAWLAFRERIFERVQAAGYSDLQPAHVLVFRYPTIADLHPGELAAQMGISKQAMNDLLRQMEARGYLYLRPDPADGRARLITLTDRGAACMELMRDASRAVAEEWSRIVGPQRFDVLQRTLRDIVAAQGVSGI